MNITRKTKIYASFDQKSVRIVSEIWNNGRVAYYIPRSYIDQRFVSSNFKILGPSRIDCGIFPQGLPGAEPCPGGCRDQPEVSSVQVLPDSTVTYIDITLSQYCDFSFALPGTYKIKSGFTAAFFTLYQDNHFTSPMHIEAKDDNSETFYFGSMEKMLIHNVDIHFNISIKVGPRPPQDVVLKTLLTNNGDEDYFIPAWQLPGNSWETSLTIYGASRVPYLSSVQAVNYTSVIIPAHSSIESKNLISASSFLFGLVGPGIYVASFHDRIYLNEYENLTSEICSVLLSGEFVFALD